MNLVFIAIAYVALECKILPNTSRVTYQWLSLKTGCALKAQRQILKSRLIGGSDLFPSYIIT